MYLYIIVAPRYEVKVKKKTACIREIAADIAARFIGRQGRVQSGELFALSSRSCSCYAASQPARCHAGIVYCFSRNECEKVAAELQDALRTEHGLNRGMHRAEVRCTISALVIGRRCRALSVAGSRPSLL